MDLVRAVHSVDPREPIDGYASMEDVLWEARSPWRFAGALFASFALVAIGLAALGVFSVVSRSVSERRRELGVRIALGARLEHELRLILGRAVKWTAAGVMMGLVIAVAAARFWRSLLFEVEAADPSILFSIALLVAAVALAASWLPARRAAEIDPAEALRAD